MMSTSPPAAATPNSVSSSGSRLLELAGIIARQPNMILIDLVAARQAAQIRLRRFDYNLAALESAIIPDDAFIERERKADDDFALSLQPFLSSLITFASNTGLRLGEASGVAAPLLAAPET